MAVGKAGTVSGRIPSLDGLRALSIVLVLLGHLPGTRGFPLASEAAVRVLDYSHLGVRTFFVISGFLITGLLLAEVRKTGRVSLPRFYLRRTLRIFPPFYVFLVVVLGAILLGLTRGTPYAFLRAATYTSNYTTHMDWAYGHTWSLSVEEQFYLLWPATILLLGMTRSTGAALAVLAIAPLVRVAELAAPAHLGLALNLDHSFGTTADALAAGCLLALMRERLWSVSAYRRLVSSRAVWLLVPLILVLAAMEGSAAEPLYLRLFTPLAQLSGVPAEKLLHAAWYALGISAINLAIALLIDRVTRFPASLTGRALNWGPVAWLGTLSYSLYLWQEPFLDRGSHFFFAAWPLNLALALTAACASFYLVERPVLRWRQRLEQRLDARAPSRDVEAGVATVAAD